jgi:hypothetical protein
MKKMTNNDIIKELYAIKDDLKYTEKCIDLFYRIQLTCGPLIEVITIMRFEMPRLYAYLKSRFDKNPKFNLLFELTIDHEFARASLGFTMNYTAPALVF